MVELLYYQKLKLNKSILQLKTKNMLMLSCPLNNFFFTHQINI